VLFIESSVPDTWPNDWYSPRLGLVRRDPSTQHDTVIASNPSLRPPAFFAPDGALYHARTTVYHPISGRITWDGPVHLYQSIPSPIPEAQFWSDLGTADAISVDPARTWAAWGDSVRLWRRDLAQETTDGVSVGGVNPHADVASNGDVVYFLDDPVGLHQIYRYRAGIVSRLTDDLSHRNEFPLTDGALVVYRKSPHPPAGGVSSIAFVDLAGDHILEPGDDAFVPEPVRDYQVRDGWIAFTRRDAEGIHQAWLRAPDGTERRLSSSSAATTLPPQAIGPPGRALFLDGTDMYVAGADLDAPVRVAKSGDRPFRVGDDWWFVAGSRVFRVAFTPGCTSAVEPSVATLGHEGGRVDVGLSAGPACAWDAVSDVGWLSVTPAAGTGNGTVAVLAGPNTGPSRTGTIWIAGGAVTVTQAGVTTDSDADGDRLPDDWEIRFGLNAWSSAGDESAGGDPDGDGRTNLEEYRAGTHPRGLVIRSFAEGAASPQFFSTHFTVFNPSAVEPASVLMHFVTRDAVGVDRVMTLPPRGRATLDAGAVAELAGTEFAVQIDSDVPVAVERTMTWDSAAFGSHAETASAAPSTAWYFAEGATNGPFDLFYLLANTSATDASVTATYLRPAPLTPLTKWYTVPAGSRLTLWIDREEFPGEPADRALQSTAVAAVFTANVPITVERAMYCSSEDQLFTAGHAAAGSPEAATAWSFAEGATGPFFDLYLLLANPTGQMATVVVNYLLPSGEIVKRGYDVEPASRLTIHVDGEDPRLADTAVAFLVASADGVPIVAERAMWWAGDGGTWIGAHSSAGAAVTGTLWALADGEQRGDPAIDTFVLVANTSLFDGLARVTVVFDDGTSVEKTLTLAARSRTNVWMPADFPAEFPPGSHRTFSVLVESLGETPAQIVVERSGYADAGGVRWAAGTNARGTLLR
jgi:hypothetical protein